MARNVLIYQDSYSRPAILDGTKDITIHPTQDLKQTVKQEGHPDIVFGSSRPLQFRWQGEWPVAPPPPLGTLTIDLSYIDRNSQKYRDFLGQCDRDDAVVQDLIIGYKLSGVDSYRTRAVVLTDQWVVAANAAISQGRDPQLAGDSYLYADNDFITPMSFVYAWGNPTAAQKAAWAGIANQTVFNIWNPQQARWGSRSAPWSGWAVNDPHNNYHLHFIRLSAAWALASGDAALLAAMGPRWTDEVAAMASISGGGDLEGTGYGYAMAVLFDAYRFWRDSGMANFANQNTHLANTIRSWVHGTVPTLDRFAPIGDQARVSEPVIYDYQRGLVMLANYLATDTTAKNEANWWLSNITHQHGDVYRQNYFDDLYPYAAGAVPATKVFRSPEVGSVFARTAWTPDATWLYVMMGKYDQSHAHQEQGGFTLFAKGNWQTVTNNIWSHSGIEQQTRDKNVIRFQRGNTIIPQQSGHQSIVDVETFIKNDATGDITITGNLKPVYTDPGVIAWRRTIDFVNGITTVTDTCAVASGVSAIFQLNVPTRPTITDNVIRVGNLKATVLAPANPTIGIVDMTTVDSDFNSGFRVDISGSRGYKVQLEIV